MSSDGEGQARKSLWIETLLSVNKMLHISVRLVRACGSKLLILMELPDIIGQARKSLWIETR